MKIIAILLFITLLGGCAAPQSTYKAAKGDREGYKDIALAANHYRVQFKIKGSSRTTAQKYALVRASELTIAQGYDWFVVEKRTLRTMDAADPFASPARPIIARNCGLLGCRTHTQERVQPMDLADTETLATLEIRMGRGVRPEKESYDAREIWEAQQKENNVQPK